MPETQDQKPVVYTGRFRHGIDGSRRVMVPAKWRTKRPVIEYSLIPWPIGVAQYLLVLPPARWSALMERLNEMSLSNEEVAVVERVIGGQSANLSLDKVGRFCLPESLVESAGLGQDALFVGRLNKFEIWDPKRFDANNRGDMKVAAEAIKNLNL